MELEFKCKRLTTKLAAARAQQTSFSGENTAMRMTARELEAMTKAAWQQLAEKYYKLSDRVRVICRVRTPTARGAETLLWHRPHSLLVALGRTEKNAFDHVFTPEATQRDMFPQVAPLVVSFAGGYHACIMAAGSSAQARRHVFATVDALRLTYDDALSVGMVGIYNDQILDLFSEGANRARKGAAGNVNHNIAATSMNLESSRSRALVFLHLTSLHR
ncbi:hypothetical protein PybrP1_003047, partial [[Pythium] brassicae (nom. inval.)]